MLVRLCTSLYLDHSIDSVVTLDRNYDLVITLIDIKGNEIVTSKGYDDMELVTNLVGDLSKRRLLTLVEGTL